MTRHAPGAHEVQAFDILNALNGPAHTPGSPGTGHQTCSTCRSLRWFSLNPDLYGLPNRRELGCFLIPLGRLGDPSPAYKERYELATTWLLEHGRDVANIPQDAPPCPAWRAAKGHGAS